MFLYCVMKNMEKKVLVVRRYAVHLIIKTLPQIKIIIYIPSSLVTNT